jgi:RecJ-like exonuclease
MKPKVDNETVFECYECHGHGHWYSIKNVVKLFHGKMTTVAKPGEKIFCPVCKGKGWLDWAENARGEAGESFGTTDYGPG